MWIDPSEKEEEIVLLDSTDIAKELTDSDDKIVTIALLKESFNSMENAEDFAYGR